MNPSQPKKNIVVLGGGFGGIKTVLKLERLLKTQKLNEAYRVFLVDKNSIHTYTPALYEIAAIPKDEASASTLKAINGIRIEDVVVNKKITFIQDSVSGLDPNERIVHLDDYGDLVYEYLVVALGAEVNYFNIPGLKEFSYPLKQFRDAIRIRNKTERLIREKKSLTIIVGGAGPSGVELIAEFANFLCALQTEIHDNTHYCNIQLLLVEASDEILHGFTKSMIEYTKKHLARLDIKLVTNAPITEVFTTQITLRDSTPLPYDLLIWTGGVQGHSVLKKFGLPLGRKGNLITDEHLHVHKQIYAVGDSAYVEHPETKKALPWNVPVAEAEASIVAKNIIKKIKGEQLISFHPQKRYPFILAIGKKRAYADLLIMRFTGFFGWVIKMLVEFRYLLFILPISKAIKTWINNVHTYTVND